MHYTITAYLSGQTNSEQRQIAQTRDKLCALELAESAHGELAGEFGVAVYRWANEIDRSQVAYHPSSHNELAPYFCSRLEMFVAIGQDASTAALSGIFWRQAHEDASEGVGRGTTPVAAFVPSWLTDSVRRHEVTSRFKSHVVKVEASRKQESKPTLLAQPRASWLRAMAEIAHAEVEHELLDMPKQRDKILAQFALEQ